MFQRGVAVRLARLATEVYAPSPRPLFDGQGYFQSVAHTQVFIEETATAFYVVFRGTEPGVWLDWLTDLKVRKWRADWPGRWHRGFLIEGKRVTAWVWLQLLRSDKPVYLAGHSLGGALATVVAAELHFYGAGHRIAGIYTFGAPRVANRAGIKWLETEFEGRYHRVVVSGDRVPNLPPVVLGYRHATRPWILTRKGELLHNVTAGVREVAGPLYRWFGFVQAHSAVGYALKLASARMLDQALDM